MQDDWTTGEYEEKWSSIQTECLQKKNDGKD